MHIKEGDKFSYKYVVEDKVCEGFVSIFNDKNPLHVDSLFAQSKGFKEKVVHGNILNGFISHFIGEYIPVKDVIIHSQTIDYLNPVYGNDVLDFTAIVTNVSHSVSAIELKFIFTNKENLKVAKGKINIGVLK